MADGCCLFGLIFAVRVLEIKGIFMWQGLKNMFIVIMAAGVAVYFH